MLPTIEEAKKELEIAGELNPGPWTAHSINVRRFWHRAFYLV